MQGNDFINYCRMFVQEKHIIWCDLTIVETVVMGFASDLLGVVCVWEAEIAPFQLDVRGEIEWCETNSCPLKIDKQAFPKGNESSPNPPIFTGKLCWFVRFGDWRMLQHGNLKKRLGKVEPFLNRMISISKRMFAHGFLFIGFEKKMLMYRGVIIQF